MKKIITFLTVLFLISSAAFSVYAEGGKVTYSGNAGEFLFEPGSDNSISDLFPDFKGVMPGDTLLQTVTVKNDADNKVKVDIYIRSLGAHEDSAEFLSQLDLKVSKSEENEMAYMFDAAASETADLTDWVLLGTLYSGGEVNLDVLLSVPTELSNEYQNQIGFLDWEFKVEEFPVDPDDPRPPQTSDNSNAWIYFVIMLCALFVIIVLLTKEKESKESN